MPDSSMNFRPQDQQTPKVQIEFFEWDLRPAILPRAGSF